MKRCFILFIALFLFANVGLRGWAEDYIVNLDGEPYEVSVNESYQEPTSYDIELLHHLAQMEGYLLFFVVVILAYFVYRFFNMFF